MRLYLLCCALLLSGCSTPDDIQVVAVPLSVPDALLMKCTGYTGILPQTEGQLSEALLAEVRGRDCANGRIEAIAEILNSAIPR
jgi:hypothetical protein